MNSHGPEFFKVSKMNMYSSNPSDMTFKDNRPIGGSNFIFS